MIEHNKDDSSLSILVGLLEAAVFSDQLLARFLRGGLRRLLGLWLLGRWLLGRSHGCHLLR